MTALYTERCKKAWHSSSS